jgi:hypothetical protein
MPAYEQPDEDHPFLLTNGRTAYHFDTRTKTAPRPAGAAQLVTAAPDAWTGISPATAECPDVVAGILFGGSRPGAGSGRRRASPASAKT